MKQIISIFFILFTLKGQWINDYDLISVKKRGKWGYVLRKTSQPVTSFEFQKVKRFTNLMAGVKKNGKWGFIDPKGILKVQHKYDDVKSFNSDYCAVKTGNVWGVIDRNGIEIIPAIYDDCTPLNRRNKIVVTQKGKKGILSASNRLLLPILYDEIFPHYYLDFYTVQKEGKAAFLNDKLKFITDFSFDPFFDNVFIGRLIKKNNLYGILNDTGKIVIPPIYDEIVTLDADGLEGAYFYCTAQNKTTLRTIIGEVLIPPKKYEWIYSIFDFRNFNLHSYEFISTIVKTKGKYGIITKNSTTYTKYDSLLFYCTENSRIGYDECPKIRMQIKGQDSLVQNTYFNDTEYNESFYNLMDRKYNHPFLMFKQNNKFGIINIDGYELTEAIYSLEYLQNNFPIYRIEDKSWLFEGKTIYNYPIP